MTFRASNPRDLLRKAASPATRQAMAGRARTARDHGTRLAASTSKPVRYTAGIAGVATIATIAATASAAAGPAGPATTQAAPAATAQAPAATSGSGSAQASAQGSGSGPTTIYDSTSPSSVPAGQHVAAYSNGAYQASNSQVSGRGNVLWIDTNGSDTHASALDVEPGDATPAGAAHWVNAKLTASPHANAIVYTFKSNWAAVQDNISKLPAWQQSHVKYWIADPTGTPHIVAGAAATQWSWGPSYDITQATPGFFH